jgi:glycosyltransferase involved in cell wall biosynthesis
MAHVTIIHTSHHDIGGIANATLFYAASLTTVGHEAEVWTASERLAQKAKPFATRSFYHPALKNAGLALIAPGVVKQALRVSSKTAAVIHQGEKLWLFGRIWLRNNPEWVLFHNRKINQRRLFRGWLTLSSNSHAELSAYAAHRSLMRRIHTIRNGPLPSAAPVVKSGVRRENSRETTVIGCLGNFNHKKGVDVLIRAAAQAIGNGCRLILKLAGDGPERVACQRLAKELGIEAHCSWPGWLHETSSFFSDIDIFCLPSRDEPFGIVVTEAMQAGLPVIATLTNGPRDIVRDGETGWLVETDHVAALASAIEDAVRNRARREEYGAAGFRRFEALYSPYAAGLLLSEALGLECQAQEQVTDCRSRLAG